MSKTVLLVPGFSVNTFSEIEASFVELSSAGSERIRFLWLVPDVRRRENRFSNLPIAQVPREPIYARHLKDAGVPYIVGNISKTNVFANLKLFRRLFEKEEIDAVYTHFGIERYWATFFGSLWGKITIWNEHWHSLGMRFSLLKRLFYLFFVDEFIAVSHFIAKTLPAGSRVHTVPNGIHVSPPTMVLKKGDMRKRFGYTESARIVLMVAAFRPQKRHNLALEICCRVLQQRPEVHFIFLGDGPTRQDFLKQVEVRRLTDRVAAPGHVDNVGDYYSIADVCMLTSLNDAFGYCILEAMAHTLPVVAFEGGGPTEILGNGTNGALVKEGDSSAFVARLIELIDDVQKRVEMGRAGFVKVSGQYSRHAWISQMLNIFENILGVSAKSS